MDMLSERLRACRKKRHLTQADVAVAVDVPLGTYTGYENGCFPSADRLVALADFYGVSLDYLFGIIDDDSAAMSDLTHALHDLIDVPGKPPLSIIADFLSAYAAYVKADAPAGTVPVSVWLDFTSALTAALRSSAAGDYTSTFDQATAAMMASLRINQILKIPGKSCDGPPQVTDF